MTSADVMGLEFGARTGEPVLWAAPEPPAVTWHEHAAAYAAMEWPQLAAHSRQPQLRGEQVNQ